MKTLTIAASRLLRYHESKRDTPCFAAELIGQQSFVSLGELDRAYKELLAGGHLVATESIGQYTLPGGEDIERPMYVPSSRGSLA